jgi:hypothetical protein
MPKVTLNPTFTEFRGALSNILYRKQFGQIFASVRADMSKVKPSEAQMERRQRFKEAVAYGKSVMADPAVHALYEGVAKERQKPTFSLMVADYMNVPSIKGIDISAYNGKVDDVIIVNATDDFGVVRVQVSISMDGENSPIESGDAVQTEDGLWMYTAASAVPSQTKVNIKVTAADRPGGSAVETQTKRV